MAVLELKVKKGEVAYYGNRRVIINRLLSVSLVEVIDTETGAKLQVEIEKLSPLRIKENNSSNLTSEAYAITPLDNEIVPESHRKEAEKRYEIISKVLNSDNPSKAVKELAKTYNIHPSTIYRWLSKFRQSGEKFSSLIPEFSKRGGKDRSKLSDSVESLIREVISGVYLDPKNRTSVVSTYKILQLKCKELGLKPPSLNTFRDRIKKLDPYLVCKTRFGKNIAQGLYGASTKSLEANYPLEMVQIDHTLLDIILVDEMKNPLGRPYLTVAIDVFSRVVLGYYLSFDPPSYLSVARTLFMVLTPKNELLREFGIEDRWDMFGIPEKISVDNAKEFRSSHLENFCREYGIIIEYRPKRTPHFGGIVERFFRTLNQKIHELPGSTFSNPKEKGEYKPDKNATLTIHEFEKWLLTYIVSYYHKAIHSELKTSPSEKFEKGMLDPACPITKNFRVITGEEAKKLKIALLPSFNRPVHKDGVHFKNLRYFDSVLKPYIGKKEKFLFKYDPNDIRFIYFYDPKTKQYYKIPCRNRKLPKLTLWEVKSLCKSYFLNKKYNEENLLEVLEKMNKIVEEAKVNKSKKVLRKKTMKQYEEFKEQIFNGNENENDLKGRPQSNENVEPRSKKEKDDIEPFEIW